MGPFRVRFPHEKRGGVRLATVFGSASPADPSGLVEVKDLKAQPPSWYIPTGTAVISFH